MDLQLRGKRALVTGSTAGIGFAAAAGLYKEGASVVVNGRTPKRVEQAIGKSGIGRRRPSLGHRRRSGHDRGGGPSGRKLPDVDILVNNLGIFEPKPFEEIPDEDWLRFFEVNVMSGVRLTRHYLPGMKVRNWGRIVFVSSESGVQIPAEMIHYGMTKTAQLAIARAWPRRWPGPASRSTACCPVRPNRRAWRSSWPTWRGSEVWTVRRSRLSSSRPAARVRCLKRFATVEEVANMIVYVCSPLASATNGAALRVDGGVGAGDRMSSARSPIARVSK